MPVHLVLFDLIEIVPDEPVQPVPLTTRPDAVVVDVLAAETAPAFDSPGDANVTFDAILQLIGPLPLADDALAVPPATATTLMGIAIAAATTSNLRNM